MLTCFNNGKNFFEPTHIPFMIEKSEKVSFSSIQLETRRDEYYE